MHEDEIFYFYFIIREKNCLIDWKNMNIKLVKPSDTIMVIVWKVNNYVSKAL